ncbi:MAG: polymer-forming cytoskeletal protein [Polyangiaceae bacterium]|nr:polymer-forming cytoskeletal protein [Polyangiaceae bacterium]
MTTPSTIGRGTTIRGSVRSDGDLDIHGFVEGSVVVTGELVIADTALIKSDVSGRRVIVRGAVAGNVSANELIVVEPGARIVGDIGAPQIGIRPGGLIRGHVATGAPLPERAPQPAAAAAQAPKGRAAPAAPAAAPAARHAAPAPAARAAAAPARAPAPAAKPAAPAPARAPAARARAPAPARAPIPAPAPTPVPAAAPPPAAAEEEPAIAEVSPEEPVENVAVEAESGGPPPPVVPAVPKGARAQVRRKGAGAK